MKHYFSLIVAAALSLTACGGESKSTMSSATPASSIPNATPASAAVIASDVATGTLAGPECTTVITSDDAMKFDPKDISIQSSCAQYTIILKHVGKMPAAAMGHNVVISKTIDKDGVLSDGASAGFDADYVKVADERVVAHTKLIGGGEETSVTFNTSKLVKGEAYEFYCSFPGHYAMMNGKIAFSAN